MFVPVPVKAVVEMYTVNVAPSASLSVTVHVGSGEGTAAVPGVMSPKAAVVLQVKASVDSTVAERCI